MSTTEDTADDGSTTTKYTVTLKPEYRYQDDRTRWIESDSVEVRDGLVIFGGDDPDRILDADEVKDIRPQRH